MLKYKNLLFLIQVIKILSCSSIVAWQPYVWSAGSIGNFQGWISLRKSIITWERQKLPNKN